MSAISAIEHIEKTLGIKAISLDKYKSGEFCETGLILVNHGNGAWVLYKFPDLLSENEAKLSENEAKINEIISLLGGPNDPDVQRVLKEF